MSGKQFSLDSHLDLVQSIVNHTGPRPVSEPSGNPPLLEDKNEIYEESEIKENKENNGLECQSGMLCNILMD